MCNKLKNCTSIQDSCYDWVQKKIELCDNSSLLLYAIVTTGNMKMMPPYTSYSIPDS